LIESYSSQVTHIDEQVVLHQLILCIETRLWLKESDHGHVHSGIVGQAAREDLGQGEMVLVVRVDGGIQAVVVLLDQTSVLWGQISLVLHHLVQVEGVGMLQLGILLRVQQAFKHIPVFFLEVLQCCALLSPEGEFFIGTKG